VNRLGFRFWLVLALLTLGRPVFAHDPFEITTLARLRADALRVELTMTRATALRLLGDRGDVRATFAPEAFPEHRSKLEGLAPSLYEITSNGSPLRSSSVVVRLSAEGEVEFELSFERPGPGRLLLRASHLQMLPEGYGSALSVVQDAPRATLGFKLLRAGDPSFDVRIGATRDAAPPKPSGAWEPFKKFLLVSLTVVSIGAFLLVVRLA